MASYLLSKAGSHISLSAHNMAEDRCAVLTSVKHVQLQDRMACNACLMQPKISGKQPEYFNICKVRTSGGVLLSARGNASRLGEEPPRISVSSQNLHAEDQDVASDVIGMIHSTRRDHSNLV